MKCFYYLLFIVAASMCMLEIDAERPAICREGSVNYCKYMQTAKACGKLRFCQLVWKPPPGYKIVKNGNFYEVLNPNIGYIHVG